MANAACWRAGQLPSRRRFGRGRAVAAAVAGTPIYGIAPCRHRLAATTWQTGGRIWQERSGINTRLAHVGNNPHDYFGFVNPPVVHASTVLFPDAATMAARARNTPTARAARRRPTRWPRPIDALEGSAGTIVVPSGLAAVTVPLLAFLSAGDHVLIVDSVYHPTRNFADTMLKRLGVEVEYYDPHVGAGIAALMKPNTKVVFTESPAPTPSRCRTSRRSPRRRMPAAPS